MSEQEDEVTIMMIEMARLIMEHGDQIYHLNKALEAMILAVKILGTELYNMQTKQSENENFGFPPLNLN